MADGGGELVLSLFFFILFQKFEGKLDFACLSLDFSKQVTRKI